MLKKLFLLLAFSCSVLNIHAQTDALFIDNTGKVGIGTDKPRAKLDVATIISDSTLGTVLGRLNEGNDSADGTYLGVRGFFTQRPRYGGKAFSLEHSFYGTVNSSISFYRGGGTTGGFVTFATGNNTERMRIDEYGNVIVKNLIANENVTLTNKLFFRSNSNDISAGMSISRVEKSDQLNVYGSKGVALGYMSKEDKFTSMLNVQPDKVGIGTNNPRAILDITNVCNGGKLSSVMGRLSEGNDSADGTYLGVRGFFTQQSHSGGKAFSLEHSFYGIVNSTISFYRGSTEIGGFIAFSTDSNTERMRIGPDGKVGIGVFYAQAGLDVGAVGRKTDYTKTSYAFIDGKTILVGLFGDNRRIHELAILSRGCIATESEFLLYSDARIKKGMNISDSKNDLSLLNKLKVTDYKYIDTIKYGNESKKGFIAQEVENVFPQAITLGHEYIPSVYAMPTQVDQERSEVLFTMAKEHHLVIGDVVKIMTEKGEKLDTVRMASKTTFTISNTGVNYNNAFVYGKQVTDFRRVDYDRLFTLNVSATQQLSKEVDSLKVQVAAMDKLKAENEELRNDLKLLKQQLGGIIAKLGYDNAAMTASVPK